MLHKIVIYLVLACLPVTAVQARDFEDSYAVFGVGAQPCSVYLDAAQKGSAELDVFNDWIMGYLSAFNVIVPSTYNILGEMEFPTVQVWLQNHCQKFPRELFINAVARLTEVLYPTRYESGLKQPPGVSGEVTPGKVVQ